MITAVSTRTEEPVAREAPAAVRSATAGWRDPRLWIGVALVAVSVVAGVRVVGAADDTVVVWAAPADAGAGAVLTADDLVARRVHFADEADLAQYWTADDALPAELHLTRAVGAGELLPRAAVGAADATGAVSLPLAVDPALVPPGVEPGWVVDVYLGGDEAPGAGTGDPVLAGATVLEAPALDDVLAVSGRRQVVVAVDEADAAAYFRATGAVTDPVLTVVRRG